MQDPAGPGQPRRRRPRKAAARAQKPRIPQRITRVGTALGIAVSVAACSAGVSRFDFPAFSLGKNDDGANAVSQQRYSGGNSTGNRQMASRVPAAPVYSYMPNHSRYGSQIAQQTYVPKYSGDPQSQPALRNEEFRVSAIERQPVQRQNLAPVQQAPAQNARSQYRDQYQSQPTAAKPAYQPRREAVSPVAGSGGSLSIDGKSVRVGQGDTLYSISRRLNVSVDALRNANGLPDNNIRLGQTLVIPGTSGTNNAQSTPSRVAAATPNRAANNNYAAPAAQVPALQVPVAQPAPVLQTPVAQPRAVAQPKPQRQAPVRTARVNPQAATTPGNNFRWPVRGRVLAKFGSKSDGSHNDGINVAVPRGTEVRAAETGVVAYSGSELKAYGKLILIRHANGWVSAYAHNDELLVKRGDKIKRGQVISKAGTTGSVTQPQVHFELRKGSSPVDPLKYIAGL